MEEQRRRTIRKSLNRFACDVLAPLGQTPAPHHQLLIRELEAVMRGETPRLMVNMPPGSAKSTYGSVIFPAWAMAQRPGIDIIGASNTAQLAEGFSRRVMLTARDHADVLGYRLTRETAQDWETTNRGCYRAAGIGGAIAGRRADLALIDDPTRTRADAESETVRESQWAWFTGDLRTRLKPGAAIVVIMTRWHEDDLGGRLLARQPGLWRVVSLPAEAGENDLLGRAPGDMLWSDGSYGYGAELARIRAEYEAAGAMRDWWALYQQSPRAGEGSLFKTAMVSILPAAPAGGVTCRAWDLAATAQTGTRDPDWTVGVKMRRTPEGRYIVLDVVRMRGGPEEVEAAISNTAMQDGCGVQISIPQDPGQAGKSQVLYLTRRLAGYNVHSSPETGDKSERAMPFASQMNVGNVSLVQGGWNRVYLEELAGFPSISKDDQVDASSRAFAALVAPAAPSRMVNFPFMGR